MNSRYVEVRKWRPQQASTWPALDANPRGVVRSGPTSETSSSGFTRFSVGASRNMGDLKVLGVGIGGSRLGFKGLGLADSRAQSCGDTCNQHARRAAGLGIVPVTCL